MKRTTLTSRLLYSVTPLSFYCGEINECQVESVLFYCPVTVHQKPVSEFSLDGDWDGEHFLFNIHVLGSIALLHHLVLFKLQLLNRSSHTLIQNSGFRTQGQGFQSHCPACFSFFSTFIYLHCMGNYNTSAALSTQSSKCIYLILILQSIKKAKFFILPLMSFQFWSFVFLSANSCLS